MRNLTAGFGARFAALVHASARTDRLTAERHAGFIASHVGGGCLALLLIPAYLAVYGQPTPFEAAVFTWFVSPIAIALFLSFTGRYETAHFLSIANLTLLVAVAAALTGGPASFFVPWIVVIPFEAALSRAGRVVVAAIAFACAALVSLFVLDAFALLPAAGLGASPAPLVAGTALAALYAGALALAVRRGDGAVETAAHSITERFRLMADSAPDMISRHSANGTALFVSKAVETLLGLPADELSGDGFLAHVHPADRHAFLGVVARAAQGAEASAEVRLLPARGPHGQGEAIWVEMRCRSFARPGADGMAGEVVAVSRDIAVRRRREAELARRREDAETASRARSHFLSSMSHDLRTPLNAIIGFADILTKAESELTRERQQEYCHIIGSSGRELLDLVSDILDLARLEAGGFELQSEPFDLARAIAACGERMATRAGEAGVRLESDLKSGLGDIVADERALRRMLNILIARAIDDSAPDATVTVAARREANQAVLSVEDAGPGLPPELVRRLGEPFTAFGPGAERQPEGTGLGLALVRGLAEIHGGHMAIDSEPQRGTRITVTLPLRAAAAGAETEDGIVPLRHTA